MIEFQLDTGSGVATYLQLVQQVHQALQLGLLEPGDQLPTAQQVVANLRSTQTRCSRLTGTSSARA